MKINTIYDNQIFRSGRELNKLGFFPLFRKTIILPRVIEHHKGNHFMQVENSIFTVENKMDFQEKALAIFRFQAHNCSPYRSYIRHLGVQPERIRKLNQIPFLPITFFKNKKVYASKRVAEGFFLSSGTTGATQSTHHVAKMNLYNQSLDASFNSFYGAYSDFHVFGLLPSYLERSGSSLINMVQRWYANSDKRFGGFYLYNHKELATDLEQAQSQSKKPILLIGVTFALLDFAERFPSRNPNVIIIETGGMKGRKKEIVHEELQGIIKKQLNPKAIHSEYGMTELLSQAYAQKERRFYCPNWMQIIPRKLDDPLSSADNGETAALNIIDLANLYSCSFLATDDIGRVYENGSFEVLGRIDASDIRGCSLLVR